MVCTHKKILQNISTFHIELHLVEMIILILMNWRLWVKYVLEHAIFRSSPKYAYLRRKQTWHENWQCGTLYTYISFWINSIWLDAYVEFTTNELWSNGFIWASAHLKLISDVWVATLQWKPILCLLTHWGRVTHICVGKLTIIGSDNGLSPERRQAIIWTNAGILLIWSLGTNVSEIVIGIQTFSFMKMHLKMSSAKWLPFVSASMC